MPVQFRHPEKAAPLSPGVLHSKQPSNLRPGQIRRGNYCHRYFVCANQNQLDEDQTVCLICDRFIPLFPNVDPLAQAKVMGYEIGFKLIKQALVFEAQAEMKAAQEAIAAMEHPESKSKLPRPRKKKLVPIPPKLNGSNKPKPRRPGRPHAADRPEPGPGEKRCSNPDCRNPILPATPEYFSRTRSNSDGLCYYCKPCQAEKQARVYEKNKLKNTAWVEAGPPIGGEVR